MCIRNTASVVVGWFLCLPLIQTAAAQDAECIRLAERIENAQRQFREVDYEVKYKDVRNTRAFMGDPVLVETTGDFTFRSDGHRWRSEENGYSLRMGTTDKTPTSTVAGFDGHVFYRQAQRALYLGEESGQGERLSPATVFYQSGISVGWLLTALRRPEAKVVERVTIDGTRCMRVVSKWTPEWDTQPRSFDIVISPQHSFLVRRVRIERGGNLDAEWEIPEVAQTESGLWYPARIRITRDVKDTRPKREMTITRFNDNPRFDNRALSLPNPLPIGIDVVDHRRGYAWHNDPWYADLHLWMQVALNWPRADTRHLHDVLSYCDPELEGEPAPPLEVAEWIVGKDPGPWDRKDRRLTLLYFFGGRAILPTPFQLSSLAALLDRYGNHGLEVVAVATASDTLDRTRLAVKQLQVSIPVAIDTAVPTTSSKYEEPGGKWGATFAAYGQMAYTGAVIIDQAGKIVLVSSDAAAANGYSALETLVRARLIDLVGAEAIGPPEELPASVRLANADLKQIKAEWINRVATEDGAASIAGNVTTPLASAPGKIRVKAKPFTKLLHTNTPGGWTVLHDPTREQSTPADANGLFEFTSLHKGAWQVTVTAPGAASHEQTVLIADHSQQVELKIELTQGDSIRGTVRSESGEPLANAAVQAIKRHLDPAVPARYTTAHLPRTRAMTDARGQFTFEELYSGHYTFRITAPGHEQLELGLIAAGKQNADAMLKRK